MITIRTPIWKTKSIGIADGVIKPGPNDVRISYKTKDGNLLFPGTYTIDGAEAKKYPTQVVKGGVVLRIIPIANMKHKEN